jgi:acetyl esterase/lipase
VSIDLRNLDLVIDDLYQYPYPYALNECYDAYHTLISSKGRCIGMEGNVTPKVVVSGDSAGGNLAVGLILMLLQESPHSSYIPGDRRYQTPLPLPEALVSIYPALDMNISNWMSDEQMALIKAPERRRVNKGVIRQKSDDYRRLTPDTPHGSDDEDEGLTMKGPKGSPPNGSKSGKARDEKQMNGSAVAADPYKPETSAAHTVNSTAVNKKKASTTKPQPLRTRLAMSSMISYFNDRILSPEMLRAMIILYIGPYNRPDFSTDWLLSPILAPEALLARFPKVYLLTGERDPLVDDTVIFAGRLRQAHWHRFQERQELGIIPSSERFDENKYVEVNLIPGISHGFLQFVSVFHDGWKYIFQCSRWMKEAFNAAEAREAVQTPQEDAGDYFSHMNGELGRQKRRSDSAGEEHRPGDMSSINLTFSSGSRLRRKSNARREREREMTGSSHTSGKGSVQKPKYHAVRSPVASRRSFPDLSRLQSEEDLMQRRMMGVTMNLGGEGEVPQTP